MIFEKNVFFLAGTTISTTGIIVIHSLVLKLTTIQWKILSTAMIFYIIQRVMVNGLRSVHIKPKDAALAR